MTYRVELRVDRPSREQALRWVRATLEHLERSGTDSMEAGGGGGGGDSFEVYAGPVPLTDRERIESLEATVARLVRGGP